MASGGEVAGTHLSTSRPFLMVLTKKREKTRKTQKALTGAAVNVNARWQNLGLQ